MSEEGIVVIERRPEDMFIKCDFCGRHTNNPVQINPPDAERVYACEKCRFPEKEVVSKE